MTFLKDWPWNMFSNYTTIDSSMNEWNYSREDVQLQPLPCQKHCEKLNYIYVSQFAHQSVCKYLLSYISCKFQQFVVKKSLPVLIHTCYSACTYSGVGFHVASCVKIQRNVHWLGRDWCLSWLCICRTATSTTKYRNF